MKCYIHVNSDKQEAKPVRIEIENYIHSSDFFSLESDILKSDVAIVLGGDGTLLQFSQKIIGHAIVVLAVNLGSLGFLTEIRKEAIIDTLESLKLGEVKIQKRQFLEVIYREKRYFALNEVVTIKCNSENLTAQDVFVEGVYLNTYLSDGLIIATSTGSTGYSLSANGPIMDLDVEAMIINPLASHTLSARPIVVSGSKSVEITNLKDKEITVINDGVHIGALESGESITVTLSQETICMVLPKKSDYFSVLREKLGWGDSYVKRIKYQKFSDN